MARLFIEHIKRECASLDGFWRFLPDPEGVGDKEKWQKGLPTSRQVPVPQVWNSECDLLTYVGVAWYERSFYFKGGTARIVFGAVMTECKVYIDGKPVGGHYGGFSEFDVIVKLSEGEHRLTVRVDNSFNEQSIPQIKVDWYHYGGIVRSVCIERLAGISTLSNRIEYKLNEDRTEAVCTPVLNLYNAAPDELTDTVSCRLGDLTVSATVTIPAYSHRQLTMDDMIVTGVNLWDSYSPNLYSVAINTSTDDLYDRVGFREIEIKDGGIYLNGNRLEIRGVNRHEQHPDFGFAFPRGLMTRDLDLIQNMGANAIRGSHYPNSKEFLDLIDERGLLFWSEIPIWGCGFSEAALGDKVVIERGLTMHAEMVAEYYNHPSIIIWGMHNEILVETENAARMSRLYYNYLKENGGNRAVVYATHHPMVDVCTDYTDILALNQYYGWYSGYEDGAWEAFFERYKEHRLEAGTIHKPVIISEFGWAAIFGTHDDEGIIWSEEYQAKMMEHCLSLFHRLPEVSGSFIWQFSDIRTSREGGLTRARGFNNKGILNEYRKPKLAYHTVKRLFNEFKAENADN